MTVLPEEVSDEKVKLPGLPPPIPIRISKPLLFC